MASLTIDPMLLADLSATCNNLGYFDESTEKYMREPECLECVKELIRFLRRDDENYEIRRALGETKVLVKDLIPIVKHHSSDAELFDVTLRLLVNLTMPVLVLYEEELPEERVSRRYYLEIVQCLQMYKEAFNDKLFWSSIAEKLTAALGKGWEDRMEDDKLLIERILILMRNVLHIPANPGLEKRTDDDASVHDQVLWAIHLAGLDDMLLFVAQAEEERQLCIHVLEVVSLMFREQNGRQLARSGAARSRQERQKDIRELEEMRRREQAAKQAATRKINSRRHPRFGGTYRVENLASISDRDLIYHKPLAKINDISFDKNKVPRKTPRNRQPLLDDVTTRRSVLSIRLFLKQFCVEFLAGAYNKLMYDAKDHLSRAKGQAHDESYYMWAVKFFMEFNRHHHFRVAYVSETLSVSMFHYLQTQLESYLEMMQMEKKKLKIWSKRLHLGLRAYQELLYTIQHMDRSSDETLKQSAQVLKSNIFYMPEYRELVYVLIVKYDPIKMTRRLLTDLVETTHVFLKLLETFSGGGRVVVKRKRVVKRKKRPTKSAVGAAATGDREPCPEFSWDGLSEQLSALIQDPTLLTAEAMPFDAASDLSMEEQKREALYRIQDLLRDSKPEEALSLLRAAREVWPEGDAFGAAEILPENEFLALREIHFCQFPERVRPSISSASADPTILLNDAESGGESEHEEEAAEDVADGREQEFDFQDYIRRFCSARVLEPYCRLLRHFSTNSAETNHCVLKMLHRVAWTHKLPAMLFQSSLFRTFQKLLDDELHCRNPRFKELVAFAKHILRKFFTVAATNNLVFVEMLFWKSEREAFELENGYESYKEQSRAAKIAWSEEEEIELVRIYEEMKNTDSNDPDQDLVDRILDNLICRDRSRRMVIKKLKDLGVVTDTRSLKGRSTAGVGGSRPPREWSEQEVQELTWLWQECREAVDPLGMIWDRLTLRRPKNRIRDKLLQLGLAADRKQLHKKRSSCTRKTDATASGDDGVRRGSDSDSDTDGSDLDSDASDTAAQPDNCSQKIRAQTPSVRCSSISASQLADSVHKYLQQGLEARDVVSWLLESLEEAVVLRGSDPDEATALVPFTETCGEAIETPVVRQLAQDLGALPPAEGEMFWRWPVGVSVSQLQCNSTLLVDCLSGKLPPAADHQHIAESSQPESARRPTGSSADELTPPTETSGVADLSATRVVGSTRPQRRLRLLSDSSDSEMETPPAPSGRIDLLSDSAADALLASLEQQDDTDDDAQLLAGHAAAEFGGPPAALEMGEQLRTHVGAGKRSTLLLSGDDETSLQATGGSEGSRMAAISSDDQSEESCSDAVRKCPAIVLSSDDKACHVQSNTGSRPVSVDSSSGDSNGSGTQRSDAAQRPVAKRARIIIDSDSD